MGNFCFFRITTFYSDIRISEDFLLLLLLCVNDDLNQFEFFFFFLGKKMSSSSSRTIYVGNLPGDTRLREVEDLFCKVLFSFTNLVGALIFYFFWWG